MNSAMTLFRQAAKVYNEPRYQAVADKIQSDAK
jgi:hypothetical protein